MSIFAVVVLESVVGAAVAAPVRTVAAMIPAAAGGMIDVGIATEHFGSEHVTVVVLAVAILDAAVAGSLGVEVDTDFGLALAAVAVLGCAVVAVIAAVAGVVGVEVVPGRVGLESVVVFGSAAEILVDEVVVVVESFGPEVDDAGFALTAGAPAAAHSEWTDWQAGHFESDLNSDDSQDESAVQDDKTEVAVAGSDSAAVGHEEDNRPASAAAEAQAYEEEKQSAANLQTVSQQVF